MNPIVLTAAVLDLPDLENERWTWRGRYMRLQGTPARRNSRPGLELGAHRTGTDSPQLAWNLMSARYLELPIQINRL